MAFRSQSDIYGALNSEERRTIRRIEQEIKSAGVPNEYSELATGQLLLEARTILEAYGLYTSWLKQFPFTYRTALRRTDAYAFVAEHWPRTLIDEAIRSGFRILGMPDKTHPLGVYSGMPRPPKKLTTAQARLYLSDLQFQKAVNEIKSDPKVLLKECFRTVEKRLARLHESEREEFCNQLVGLMMTMIGISEPKEFCPKKIPEGFPIASGRERSEEVRERIAAAAEARWARIRGYEQGGTE